MYIILCVLWDITLYTTIWTTINWCQGQAQVPWPACWSYQTMTLNFFLQIRNLKLWINKKITNNQINTTQNIINLVIFESLREYFRRQIQHFFSILILEIIFDCHDILYNPFISSEFECIRTLTNQVYIFWRADSSAMSCRCRNRPTINEACFDFHAAWSKLIYVCWIVDEWIDIIIINTDGDPSAGSTSGWRFIWVRPYCAVSATPLAGV